MTKVLFLCTGNSCRSQIGEVVLNAKAKGRFHAVSAGASPVGFVHPMALEVLAQAGYPTQGLRSKSWEEFKNEAIDVLITVCDSARQSCPVWPSVKTQLHWSLKDPAHVAGSPAFKKAAFQATLSELEARISAFIEGKEKP